MELICWINRLIGLLFVLCYGYQAVYLLVSLRKRPPAFPLAAPRHYGVLIAARNEEKVIGQLIASIRTQRYPRECLDIFVVADNCTDRTAQVAREAGATVFVRYNNREVGKSYALDYLFQCLSACYSDDWFDGYFIFDADNLLSKDYVEQMNRTFAAGYPIVTSYRNCKNFGDNWITSGYGLWFLREARYLNGARMVLGSSCTVSGTGYLISSDILPLSRGWPYHLMCEDIQLTAHQILQGKTIGYCPDAMFYDEQPSSFRVSFFQRLRWAKGNLQIFHPYGKDLFRGALVKHNASCFDAIMAVLPAVVLTIASVLAAGGGILWWLGTGQGGELLLQTLIPGILGGYGIMFLAGGITLLTENRRIHAAPGQKVRALVTFPLFMATYMPIAICALFAKVEWKAIPHRCALSLQEVEES